MLSQAECVNVAAMECQMGLFEILISKKFKENLHLNQTYKLRVKQAPIAIYLTLLASISLLIFRRKGENNAKGAVDVN